MATANLSVPLSAGMWTKNDSQQTNMASDSCVAHGPGALRSLVVTAEPLAGDMAASSRVREMQGVWEMHSTA